MRTGFESSNSLIEAEVIFKSNTKKIKMWKINNLNYVDASCIVGIIIKISTWNQITTKPTSFPFQGFSPEVMKALVESSNGGAREQLSMALAKMVDRHDCGHEYANNRAREMVAELAQDNSLLSSEIRYLQPLIYRY